MSFARWLGRLAGVAVAFILGSAAAQTLNWRWSNPLPHGNDIVDLAWNGTLGVEVGDSGQVYTSPDLLNWSPQNSGLTNALQAVAFFNHRIIIGGAGGMLAYSDNGTNFTPVALGITNWIAGLAASAKLAVAVVDGGLIYTSVDGAKWASQGTAPNISENWLNSVAWGNGNFVAVGDNGYIATSANGTNWSSGSSLNEYTYGDLEQVKWINGSGSTTNFPYQGFWIVTDNYTDSGESYGLYSNNNGGSWNPYTQLNPPTNVLYTVAADAITGLLAGDATARLGATTGVGKAIAWPEQVNTVGANTIPPWTYFAAASRTNGVYVLTGYDGRLVASFVTNNLYGWYEPNYSQRDWLWQVTAANGLYVAVGDNARVMTSLDGAAWSVEAVPQQYAIAYTNTTFLCVGGTTNFLLAAGTGGSLATSAYSLVPVPETNLDGSVTTNYSSTLGIIWQAQPAPANTTNDLAGVGYFRNKFYLAGGNGTLLGSLNGTNWSTVLLNGTNYLTRTPATTNYLSAMTVYTNNVLTNGLLVLGGNWGTLLTSTNGTNWVAQNAGTTNWLFRARTFGSRVLMAGENGTLLASTNGSNWTLLNSGTTNWLNDAVMVSNTCYVVGNAGTVLASTNFLTATNLTAITWSKPGTITSKALEGTATQNGQLVAVGFEGTILRSQIIPQPVNFLQYAQLNGYNVWSVNGPVDQQFTLDSSTNLHDWVTGPALNLVYSDGTLIFYSPQPTNAPRNQYWRCTLAQ